MMDLPAPTERTVLRRKGRSASSMAVSFMGHVSEYHIEE